MSVSVAQPPEIGLADWMSRMRDWLNHQRIEPAAFTYHHGAFGDQICEVSFRDRNQAELFAAKFNHKHLR